MDAQPTSLITRMFSDIETIDDPRADNARHFLTDILVLAMLGVMCGMDDYPGIVEYARDEYDWLSTFLSLPHGIPSVSTFRRVFAALKPWVLLGVMQRWSGELSGLLAGKQIAIDGKTLRRSFEHAWDKSGLHLITAWCVQENLVLAQLAVDEKSNEITAVPELLKLLDIRGAVVTVDALNTQTQTAEQVVKGGGDYVMAVKENHPTLCDTIQRNLDEMILEKFAGVEHVYHETTDGGHGRIDTVRDRALPQPGRHQLQQRQQRGARPHRHPPRLGNRPDRLAGQTPGMEEPQERDRGGIDPTIAGQKPGPEESAVLHKQSAKPKRRKTSGLDTGPLDH